ncbi:LCP family protein [Streptomyces sp. NPDC000594]|uniref:LCP family protein n=1 Tax=Streptomyces sp. NPDC000594 TaxID=3154261 RepID=UPI00333226E0
MDTDVTDSAGTLAEPEAPAGDEGGATSARPPGDGPAPGRRRWRWLRWIALAVSLLLLAAAGAAWWFYQRLDAEITTDTATATELRTHEKERPKPVVLDARNILIMGSDTREGKGNRKYGRDDGGKRSDTTILLHLAAGRDSATAMSIPRDLMVEMPSCRQADGTRSRAGTAQFNSAFSIGGAACTIRTVEKMTGIRIDHHVIVDFRGFERMVDAVDGVEVCLPEAVDDPDARLVLDAGRQTLDGEQALGFVRARKTLGGGSDTERMERQQQFLGSLVKKVQSNGVLLNPARLYPVLKAATSSLTTDPGLDSLKDLYDLASSLRDVPADKVQFLTVPREPHIANVNRDQLMQPDADRLFQQVREDAPITVVPRDDQEEGSPESAESDSDAFTGTNAAVGMCG